MTTAPPPSAKRLPVEPARPCPLAALKAAAERRAATLAPYRLSSSDFDVELITPIVIFGEQHRSTASLRTTSKDTRSPNAELPFTRPPMEFGPWSDYVAAVPPVLLVRVTPRLVEGFCARVGRAAAQTQGVSLPPLKRLRSGFARLRALCGAAEVAPIHPFEIAHRRSGRTSRRSGSPRSYHGAERRPRCRLPR